MEARSFWAFQRTPTKIVNRIVGAESFFAQCREWPRTLQSIYATPSRHPAYQQRDFVHRFPKVCNNLKVPPPHGIPIPTDTREKPHQSREAVILSCGNCDGGERPRAPKRGYSTWHS